jgi:hypothetical protein
MFEGPAAHGQSSTESSKPSPSESAADASGAKAMRNIKITKNKALRDESMITGLSIPKRGYGVIV